MKKVIALSIVQTNSLYGFSCIVIPLTVENLNEIERLKQIFKQVQTIDNINQLVYYYSKLDFTLMNDDFHSFDFSKTDCVLAEISEEAFEEGSNCEENEYKVEEPSVRVSEGGIQIVYPSKYTADEVYGKLDFSELANFLNPLKKWEIGEDAICPEPNPNDEWNYGGWVGTIINIKKDTDGSLYAELRDADDDVFCVNLDRLEEYEE